MKFNKGAFQIYVVSDKRTNLHYGSIVAFLQLTLNHSLHLKPSFFLLTVSFLIQSIIKQVPLIITSLLLKIKK
jgi:hypothetical protein